MRLKQLISLSVFALVLSASDNSAYLSSLKQEKLDIDKQTNELESDNLKYDWVNQVTGSYSYTNSDQSGIDKETNLFSITVDQPIFRSGGIYYAVQYSGANREFLRLSTKLSEQNLIKSVISSWLLMRKYDLQIQRQKHLIDNAKIDVIRKKEQYESGFLDSSYLDNAILNKSSLEKSLIDIESLRYSQLMVFKSLSDSDYLSITPPKFTMIEKNEYLDKSILIKQQSSDEKRTEYLKNVTVASYLPKVSVFGGYYDSREDSSVVNNNNYTQYGIKVSMPLLDVNRGRSIELKQLDFLKSKLQSADTKKEEGNNYQDAFNKIELLKKKIDIAINDESLYNSLLVSTNELFEAGEKTIYDVDTLKNSQQTMILDKKIYEIDAQQILLDLYAKMYGEI